MLVKLFILIACCLQLHVQFLCDAAECESLHTNEGGDSEMGSCAREETETENVPSGRTQRTFTMIKPDGVQRNLVGRIIHRFESKGLKLVALKFVLPKDGMLREFYVTSADEPFFEDMIGYVKRGPVIAMVWEGYNAVNIGRSLLTGGNRLDPRPGSIRGDYGSNDLIHRFTVAHGSDSVAEAERELRLWFNEDEIISWHYSNEMWIYQK